MGQNLTGQGLFTRAATETVPHLTSVAVDLGLMPFAPQADKPWACRVTVSLMRPGKDGLAKDVADVERLASLGHDLLQRLGHGTVFAAAGGDRASAVPGPTPSARGGGVAVRRPADGRGLPAGVRARRATLIDRGAPPAISVRWRPGNHRWRTSHRGGR